MATQPTQPEFNVEVPRIPPQLPSSRGAYAVAQTIDAEINRLQQARALLTDQTVPLKRDVPSSSGRRKVSAEGRARMAAAQKARNQ